MLLEINQLLFTPLHSSLLGSAIIIQVAFYLYNILHHFLRQHQHIIIHKKYWMEKPKT